MKKQIISSLLGISIAASMLNGCGKLSVTTQSATASESPAYIEPEDLGYFDPYVSCYKLVDRYDDTDVIFNNLYSYATRTGSGGKPREYYNL